METKTMNIIYDAILDDEGDFIARVDTDNINLECDGELRIQIPTASAFGIHFLERMKEED